MALQLHYLLSLLVVGMLVFNQGTTTSAKCYVQGSLATVVVNFYMESEYVEIPVIGRLIAVINTSRGVYVGFGDSYIEVLAVDVPANVTITYLTEIAEYRDGAYVAEFNNHYNTLSVFLPHNAVLLEVSNLTHMSRTGEYLELIFTEGFVRFAYMFPDTGEERTEGIADRVWVAALIFGIIWIPVLMFYYRRRRLAMEMEVLDERDRAIVEALKSGPMTPQELIKLTDMSKATFYRRIKRLIDMGYVEQIKKEGRVYYRLKEKSGK